MFDISDEKYEELQQILEKQNRQEYTFEEAKEIGEELVDFYALLMQLGGKEREDDK
ncbi:MAG TPA: hypothetical protein VLG09_02770 [Candidatus Saccharimonadales bacterium]|nr:hypothetical protein [Candidatus Saccharimonadales bacterium]